MGQAWPVSLHLDVFALTGLGLYPSCPALGCCPYSYSQHLANSPRLHPLLFAYNVRVRRLMNVKMAALSVLEEQLPVCHGMLQASCCKQIGHCYMQG